MTRLSLLSIVFLSSLALATGCPAEDDDGGGTPDGGGGGADAAAGDTFTSLFARMGGMCGQCHAPGAPGFVAGTEATMDWSSQANAHTSLMGMASGLIGNFTDCNDVPLIGADSASSLVVAAVDQDTRTNFDVAAFPNCDMTTISDMSLKLGGPLDAQIVADLKAWIDAGAPNN